MNGNGYFQTPYPYHKIPGYIPEKGNIPLMGGCGRFTGYAP